MGGSRAKKASDVMKQPASKKRKKGQENENKENATENGQDNKESDKIYGAEKPKAKLRGRGKKSDNATLDRWTEEIDRTLTDIIKRRTNNKLDEVIPWKETYLEFQHAFPDSQRSFMSVESHWFQIFKPGMIELTDDQVMS
ncbi:hypothetical protein ABW20_dc0106841 [Dactylellina cionopaga]|nr:hypothetical protein ABW20_dc0106841 [Dactylellina cionopaga]